MVLELNPFQHAVSSISVKQNQRNMVYLKRCYNETELHALYPDNAKQINIRYNLFKY